MGLVQVKAVVELVPVKAFLSPIPCPQPSQLFALDTVLDSELVVLVLDEASIKKKDQHTHQR